MPIAPPRLPRRLFLKGLLASVASFAATSAYAFGIEPIYRLRVQRYAIAPATWPAGLGLRVAVIADLHASPPQMSLDRVREIVAATNALGADVILLLGDYLASHRWVTERLTMTPVAEALAPLTAPLGVFAVLGNHDWWDDRAAQRRGAGPVIAGAALEAVGIRVLENDAVRLSKNGQPFWLLGLGDQLAFWQRRGSIGVDDLPATLARLTDDAPAILMAHEPPIFDSVPDRIALTLCGHTHGGQVRLFGWSPVSPARAEYTYGHVVHGLKHLIVSGGLGCSIMPVRFGVPPEIVLADLGAVADS